MLKGQQGLIFSATSQKIQVFPAPKVKIYVNDLSFAAVELGTLSVKLYGIDWLQNFLMMAC